MDPLNNTAVTYEPLPWNISPAAAYVRAAQQQQGKYRAAISADIADLTVNLPSDVLADAEDASREATRFDAELRRRDRAVRVGPVAHRVRSSVPTSRT